MLMTNTASVRYEIIFFVCLFKAHDIFNVGFYFFQLIDGKGKGRRKTQIHIIDIYYICTIAAGWILPLRPACADVTGMRTRLCYFLTSHLMQDDETRNDI